MKANPMSQTLHSVDYLVFLTYFLIVAFYGYWIYNRKKKSVETTNDFFLAEGSLTWWAIGASLIASNISAEQFIGMSGAGFTMGLAVASYEWMAAATLIIVAVFFMPVYLKNRIYTMPQFLHQRYNGTVAMIMAVFWLLLYVVVNLTSILYLGALAINSISGINIYIGMSVLAIFALFITLGGMKVIGYTDIVQVFVLVIGGLATTYLALNLVAEKFGGSGVGDGFGFMLTNASDHFHMILKRDNPSFNELPGLTVLLGGMWIANLNYWGCNQYITQRALGADLQTARSGILFAAFLKLLMPVIVILPGIAAFVLHQQGDFASSGLAESPDKAYPLLMNLLPVGLKGLAFAALTAAIVASLAGKANSIATIFSLDIYKKKINLVADDAQVVKIGRYTVLVSLIIAVIIAPLLLGGSRGVLQFIQEYTGFVSPGIFAMFIMGFFWKNTTSNAALFATIGGFLLSIFLKFLPLFVNLSFLATSGFAKANASGIFEIPFLDRMGFVFLLCIIAMVAISYWDKKNGITTNPLEVDTKLFSVNTSFAVAALIILGILVALYTAFW
jgi:SSS family solute:Na+ symporter